MKLNKISQIWDTAFQTKVIKGGKLSFIFYFFLTHGVNVAKSALRKFPAPVAHLLDNSAKRFVISNSVGKFLVRPFNDSFTISAPYFESDLRRWVGMPKQKRIALDIGANIGRYSLLAALAFGYERTVAVEANPITFDVLKANIGLNDLEDKVTLVQKAVSNNADPVTFEVDTRHLGGGRIVDKESGAVWDTVVTVQAVPVDALCLDQNMRQSEIDFVKMDVEGFEFEVLSGMTATLAAMPAGSYMMIEISDRNRDKCIGLIQDAGFSLVESKACDYLFTK